MVPSMNWTLFILATQSSSKWWFGTTLRYKDLSCNMFFNYRIGNKVVNMARMNAESMYGYDNQSIATNWRCVRMVM